MKKDKKINETSYILDKEDFKSIREKLSTKDPRKELDLESKIDFIISKTTPRQSYIIIRILEGFHLKEIAEKLKVSKSTVSLEIANIRTILKEFKDIL
jgi:DNA-binding NarL/FixJ family response regulator